jgi:inhibitor of KinA
MDNVQFSPLGDSGIVVSMGDRIDRITHEKVMALSSYLEEHPFDGMIEMVPGFTTVSVYYDPIYFFYMGAQFPYEWILNKLRKIVSELSNGQLKEARVIEIPVCYGGEFGPDLEDVAIHNGLTQDEVIRIHSETEYLTYMLGFAPGFPYLGGMNSRIATPRRHSPRLTIPAGSVGIGGEQTGIYPMESPGGWQLIGKTPLSLFRSGKNSPCLLRAGDTVRFRPITREEYDQWEGID